MSRNEQAVKITRITEGPWKGEDEYDHPAFGQISLHRCRGGVKLYGSALDRHDEFIQLQVTGSTQRHGLGQNWYHSDNRPLIELRLSPAQFADLITGLNIGGGVPCTLTRVDHKDVPEIPWDHQTEAKKIVDRFKEEVAETVDGLNKFVGDATAMLAKKGTLTKDEREQITRALDKFNQLYKDNAPFMVEQFQDAASKVATAAKAEVEAFAHRVTVETGVQVLREAQTPEQKRLREGGGK